MNLTFITGRAGADKSGWIYRSIQNDMLASADRPIYLVVPAQSTLRAERELIAALQAQGLMQVQVVSPARLADAVFSQTSQSRHAVIGESGLAMALRASAAQVADQLQAFRSVLNYAGFSLQMVQFISELKRFDVSPDMLVEASAHTSGALRAKSDDIALIYRSYAEYMQSHCFIDGDDRFNQFIQAIPDASFLRGCHFYFDGFDYLSPQNCRIILEFLRVGGKVALSVDFDRDADAAGLFDAGWHNIDQLTNMATEIGADVITVHVPQDSAHMPPDAAHLEKYLFSRTAPVKKREGDVTVCRAADVDEEVEAAACWIISHARAESLRWRDFAVLSGSSDAYAPVISRVFARYGIPVFLDARKDIIRHPAVRLILALIQVQERNFRSDDVLRLAKTGFLGIDEDCIDFLEMYLTAFSIRGSRAWSTPWGKGQEEFDLARLNECRERIYDVEHKLLQFSGGRKAPGSQWAKAIYQVASVLKLDELLDAHAESLKQLGLLEESAISSHLWNALVELLDQLGEIIGEEPLTLNDLSDILRSGIESVDIGIIPTGVDQVLVGSIGRAKYGTVRHMLILGACDNSLSEVAKTGTVFTAREVDHIAELGVVVSRGSKLKEAQRRFALYETITKGSESLLISWPSVSADHSESERDRVLESIMRLLCIERGEVLPAAEIIDTACAVTGDLGRLAVALGRHLAGENLPKSQFYMLNWRLSHASHAEQTQALLRMLHGDENPQQISAVNLLLGGVRRISSSQLETYADCPFKHMVQYALAPQQWREHGVRSADAGQYVHAVMEGFSRRVAQSGQDPARLTEDETATMMSEEADRCSEEFNYGVLHSDAQMVWTGANLKRICMLAANTYINQMKNGQFLPFGQELRLGKGAMPLAPIDTPDGSFAMLDGRIDRLDVFQQEDQEFFRVIDYKTGKASASATEALNGLEMQTWLYVHALRTIWNQFRKLPGKPAGAFIFPLADPWVEEGKEEQQRLTRLRLSGWCLDDASVLSAMDRNLSENGKSELFHINRKRGTGVVTEEYLNNVLTHVVQTAGQEITEMRGGRMAAHPWRRGRDTACATCSYGALCRFGVLPVKKYRRLLNDEEAAQTIIGTGGTADDELDS